MVTPRYRVRYRFLNLTGRSGEGLPQFTVNAWRVTFLLNASASTDTRLDNVSFGDLCDPATSGGGSPLAFTVGGVFMPDGTPAIVDQQLLIDRANRARGVLVLEYLEPLNS